MGIVLVLAIAVAVGVLVYRLTAGGEAPARDAAPAGPDDAASWRADSPSAGSPTGGGRSVEVPDGYIPVAAGGPSWQGRLGGAMGLVIAVAVGAIGLAFALWALMELASRLFENA